LKAGDFYAGSGKLVAALQRLGDLLSGENTSGQVYAEPLVSTIKRFQARHGLEPDGRLGAETINQLNVRLGQRVKQLELTLERWRWIPHSFARPPIVVNIRSSNYEHSIVTTTPR